MSATVEVIQQTDVAFSDGSTPIVVLANDDVETIVTGDQGPPGPPGPPSSVPGPAGPAGQPGNTILYGTINPTGSVGIDGNFYINTATDYFFGPKVSGAWPAGTSLIGPSGPPGAQGPPGTPGTPGAGAPATAPPIMDGIAAVGTSTLFARQDHVHPFDTATVRNDAAQSLTLTQQQQARANIYAAPLDALAYNGLQINGAMEVSQEFGTAGMSISNGYACDGWKCVVQSSIVFTAAQVASAIFPGFAYSLGMAITTAQPSLGAGDYVVIQQAIEGWRVARLGWGTPNAQPVTIGFWSAHHRTGIYTAAIRGGGPSYTFTYTHNVADIAQFNIVTIPGCTTGTWPTGTASGIGISFALAVGSTFIAPSANIWLAGNYLAAPGQINAVAATTDVFRLTGVTVLPGSDAPSAVRSSLIMRPYDQELLTCQRHYYNDANSYNMPAYIQDFTFRIFVGRTPVVMRATPTIGCVVTQGSKSLNATTTAYETMYEIKCTGVPAGNGCSFNNLVLDARL